MAKSKVEIETVQIEMSHLDYLLISHVRELRIARGISQMKLTQKMGLSEGFVGKVELLYERAKYNIRHLHLLAKALEISLEELIPIEKPSFDMVLLTLEKRPKINKDGSVSNKKITELVKIEAAPKRQHSV